MIAELRVVPEDRLLVLRGLVVGRLVKKRGWEPRVAFRELVVEMVRADLKNSDPSDISAGK